jgi:hypothetical protein
LTTEAFDQLGYPRAHDTSPIVYAELGHRAASAVPVCAGGR